MIQGGRILRSSRPFWWRRRDPGASSASHAQQRVLRPDGARGAVGTGRSVELSQVEPGSESPVGMTTRHSIQFVQQYPPILSTSTGDQYVARAYADRQQGGLWEAWLVFFSLTTGAVLATDRETTQGKLEHIL